MNGLERNGVSLYLGKIPYRKQECFYFVEGSVITPVAYVAEPYLPKVKQLWEKLTGEKEG